MKLYNTISGEAKEIDAPVESERCQKSTTPWCKEMPAQPKQEETINSDHGTQLPKRKLFIEFTNCYGIPHLKHSFTFGSGLGGSYSIYAPNGTMKTCFARTFEDLSKGVEPKEERFNRETKWVVKTETGAIKSESIFVLKSEIDIATDGSAITNILVNPENKARYDELLVDLDKKKASLMKSLKSATGIKKEPEI